ncbi:MAG: maleylacetoacetate isomerase [Myxococcota bacterium]
MRLYGYWRSSASWRVRIGLALKGVAYDNVPVNLRTGEQNEAAHEARNPLHKVPVLEWTDDDGTHRMTQSMAILMWLDAQVPTPPLFPSDPLLRARVIELAEVVNTAMQPLQNSSVLAAVEDLGGDRTPWAHRWVEAGLRALDQLSAPLRGRYLCGDEITVADLFFVPQMYGARRFGVDLAPFDALTAIESRLAAHEAFVAADASNQPDAVP